MTVSKRSLLKHLEKVNPSTTAEEKNIISEAYDFAEEAHKGQKRANGDPYMKGHCAPVAKHVIDMGMDSTLICAALLHDTIEDTDVTEEQITLKFGKEVGTLVEGVSKFGKLKYRGNERHVESLRKFFVSVAQDVRVVVLKLADRWHNLETLKYLPEPKTTTYSTRKYNDLCTTCL